MCLYMAERVRRDVVPCFKVVVERGGEWVTAYYHAPHKNGVLTPDCSVNLTPERKVVAEGFIHAYTDAEEAWQCVRYAPIYRKVFNAVAYGVKAVRYDGDLACTRLVIPELQRGKRK